VSGRFLFVTWDGGGNTAPVYPLIRRLIARGHRVGVLGQSSQGNKVKQLGAEFYPLPAPDWTPGKALEDEMDRVGELLLGPATAQAVLDAIERTAADVTVVDCLMIAALAAAERFGSPSVALFHFLYEQFVGEGSIGRMFSPMLPLINEVRNGLGLPGVESLSALFDLTNVVIVACPPEFDAPMQAIPSNVRYIGAVLEKPPSREHSPELQRDENLPQVLVSLSTTLQHQQEVLGRIAAALATLPVRATITVGPALDPAVLVLAPNVTIKDYVPHADLLPNCSLVVTHAGMGTVINALAHGVPLLCVPMGREQPDNAARVEALGAGLAVSPDATVEEIRAAICQVLGTPSHRMGALRMAEIIARQDGLTEAASELEKLLR